MEPPDSSDKPDVPAKHTTEMRPDTTTIRGPINSDDPDAEPAGYLTVLYGPDDSVQSTPVPLPRGLFLIGRDVAGPGISVSDPRVSRLHVRLGWDSRAELYRLGDAGSSNGTRLNGERIGNTALSRGDLIRVGDTLLLFSGADPMAALKNRATRAADSPLSLLIVGETGTGKEVMARHIHDQSGRSGAFVPVNCATLPRELISAELFGHTRGAFSGAKDARAGLFQSAAQGTLMLDEIGELPLEQQPALLRVLQERKVRPVGGDRELEVDVRVLAATNVDLQAATTAGTFRADLYARLAEMTLELPPLRERKAEVLPLLYEFARQAGCPLSLTPDAAEALVLWKWPFNVRELESFARSFAAVGPANGKLDRRYLESTKSQMLDALSRRPETLDGQDDQNEPTRSSTPERDELRAALTRHRGNVSAAAKEMGKPRAQIYRWLKFYGLRPEAFR